MGALVSELLELIVGKAAVFFVDLASLAPGVLSPVPLPQEGIDENAHADHAERDAVAADVAWGVGGRVDEGRHDAGCVADCELQARCGCAFTVSGGVVWKLVGVGKRVSTSGDREQKRGELYPGEREADDDVETSGH